MRKVFCHILLFNTPVSSARRCVESVLAQEGVEVLCAVSDNGGASQEALHACAEFPGCVVWKNNYNFGFCGGHNIGALRARRWGADFFVVLNPDIVLTPGALMAMVQAFERDSTIGMVTPKLLRSDEQGHPVNPPLIDAAGMFLTATFRHFDTGTEEIDVGQYDQGAFVFGGTGACLMISLCAVGRLEISGGKRENDIVKVHPDMQYAPERILLFDEGFFAYREDAELSFRAQCMGVGVWYEPSAVALHVRHQRGTTRRDPLVNYLSVKNRFLLTALYSSWTSPIVKFLTVCRNIFVIMSVLVFERSSLGALSHATILRARALERKKEIEKVSAGKVASMGRWFGKQYE